MEEFFEDVSWLGPQRSDAIFVLSNFKHLVRWKPEGNDSILDVGCGFGEITANIILPELPPTFSRLCGLDFSEELLDFARRKHTKHKNMDFILMDVGQVELPVGMVQSFDHIFSFNCLHWIKDHTQTLINMHKILKPGGDALLMFVAYNPIYDVYINLSRNSRWAQYMANVDEFIPNYLFVPDQKKFYESVMQKSPFSHFEVHTVERSWQYESDDVFRRSMEVMNIFDDVPVSLREEYYNDVVTEARRLRAIPYLIYKIFVVYARK